MSEKEINKKEIYENVVEMFKKRVKDIRIIIFYDLQLQRIDDEKLEIAECKRKESRVTFPSSISGWNLSHASLKNVPRISVPAIYEISKI